jgi:hypothetical protein
MGRSRPPKASVLLSAIRTEALFGAHSLASQMHEQRRHLFRTLLDEAWRVSNWPTHAKAFYWYAAEAAVTTVEQALGLAASLVIRRVRAVPEACPACGSNRLSSQRGFHSSLRTSSGSVRLARNVVGGEPVPILSDPDHSHALRATR